MTAPGLLTAVATLQPGSSGQCLQLSPVLQQVPLCPFFSPQWQEQPGYQHDPGHPSLGCPVLLR